MQPWEWPRELRKYHIENPPYLPADYENRATNGKKLPLFFHLQTGK